MNQQNRVEMPIPSEDESVIHGYRVVFEQTATGWCAYTPDLPTILGAAETREEVDRQMAEAIPLHLEAMRRDRQDRPWLYTPEKLSPELRAVFARIDAA
jgi:predicted RNase H-like HicB family nuclease